MIVRLNLVLNRAVVDSDWRFDFLCGSRLQNQSGCITSVEGIKLWLLTLTRRAQLVCDSPDRLQDETDYLNNVFSKNNYNADFVRRNAHGKADSNPFTNVNCGPVTTATLPYIRGTAEATGRILQPYNIRVAHNTITTLLRLLTNVKDKDKLEYRQGAVYNIKCCDFWAI